MDFLVVWRCVHVMMVWCEYLHIIAVYSGLWVVWVIIKHVLYETVQILLGVRRDGRGDCSWAVMHHDSAPFSQLVSVLVLEIESSVELQSLGNGLFISTSSRFLRVAKIVLNVGGELPLAPLLVESLVFDLITSILI